MTRLFRCREFRLLVPGKPESFRSKNAKDYKRKLKSIGKRLFRKPLSSQHLEVRIDYFHERRRRMDMDNIAKCILDALNGVAYIDDKQIVYQHSIARCIDRIVKINEEAIDIVKPLADYSEYVLVRILDSRGH